MTSSPKADATAHFPGEGSSASAARRFVAATLDGWGLERLEETACLLVSELVSNVVLHADTELDVHLGRGDGRVRVEVHDRDPRLPQRKFYSPTSATGRGMVFIAELSEAWGADPTPNGKMVWFELDDEAPPVPAVQVPGAEFHLEDWDDLAKSVVADDPRAETSGSGSGRGRGGSQRTSGLTAHVLVACR